MSTESEIDHSILDKYPFCVNYRGYINKNGYGQLNISVNGKWKSITAHRNKWIDVYGSIPEGMQVLHRCDNRKCININHLFLGTNADNVRDKISKGRQIRGTQMKQTSLSEEDVMLIRFLYQQGNSTRTLEQWFPVKKSSIHKIVSNKTWTHV